MEIDDDNESLSDKNIITSFQHQYQKRGFDEILPAS